MLPKVFDELGFHRDFINILDRLQGRFEKRRKYGEENFPVLLSDVNIGVLFSKFSQMVQQSENF